MKHTNKQSVTIGIPTCYSGASLIRTVESIRNAELGNEVKILVTADRTPLSKKVLNSMKKFSVEVTWNKTEGSQFKKIKQMINNAESDLYIHTQDDVIFEKNTIVSILDAFKKNKKLTMAGIRILPLEQKTFFESAMASMLLIVDNISGYWNGSDNHLSSSGRCLAFRVKQLKKLRMPHGVVNGDMFLYLENKRLKGEFKRLDKSFVLIRCPQRLKDQIAPSSRYLYSRKEMQAFFHHNLDSEYAIPLLYTIKSFIKVFFRRPLPTAYYLMIRVYTFIFRQTESEAGNPLWKVDFSTKSA